MNDGEQFPQLIAILSHWYGSSTLQIQVLTSLEWDGPKSSKQVFCYCLSNVIKLEHCSFTFETLDVLCSTIANWKPAPLGLSRRSKDGTVG